MKNQHWYFFIVTCFLMLTDLVNADGFVIITNPSVSEGALAKDEIKQIFLANQVNWKNGQKIVIISLSPDAAGADDLTKEVMGMTAQQAKKYWLTKVFNGVLPSVPAAEDSSDEVIAAVAKTAGAVAILPTGSKMANVKVMGQK